MAVSAAKYFEVRWRVQGSGENWTPPRQTSPVSALSIAELEPSKTYEIEVRAVSDCGAASLWASYVITTPDNTQRVSQANINMLRVGGIGSAWTGFAISYVNTPTSATISCTAGTLQDGANNPTYAASSTTVSGTAGTTVTYYLYYDDPTGTGGTLPLGISTTYSDLSANQGRIFVGAADVVYPTSGSGGGGGSPGGGGGCVTVDMWLLEGLLAGRVQMGQAIDGAAYDPVGMLDRIVETNLILAQPCMRLITESGCTVDASCSTPMTMPDGSVRMFPDMLGELALVNDHGDIRWERVIDLYPIGVRPVVHIRMNNQCFFAGADANRRVATHNLIMVK